jgi:formiminotetrahydrofolate cyclodeaminase
MPKEKIKEEEKEQKVSIYDPAADAFREVPISVAKRFVASAKETEKLLAEMEEK